MKGSEELEVSLCCSLEALEWNELTIGCIFMKVSLERE